MLLCLDFGACGEKERSSLARAVVAMNSTKDGMRPK